jgi:uncharacterized protein
MGQSVDELQLDTRGVIGDRRWGLRDLTTGNILTGRRVPELLHAVGGDGMVTLPSGVTTRDAGELSAWLGRSVELVSAADDERSTYEVPLDPLDGETNWVSWQGPAGSFVDSTRTSVSLISTASIQTWGAQRFRMNIVLDLDNASASSHDEAALVGQQIRIGSAVLNVVKEVDRCVMVTRPQPGLERHLDVLKHINKHHAGCLGIGSLVVQPGIIRIGDTVETLR